MQRLNGMDTSFVYLDMPAAPMQVGMCCLFDPRTVPRGYSFDAVRERILERLELIPPFRRRVRTMPAHFHRPVWIDDPDFDIDWHLRRVVLPAPGSLTELERFTADVMSRPLDHNRPLWEMHIVEGLADGTIAAVTKMHHATIDGVSAAELAINLLDLDPDVPSSGGPAPSWSPANTPSLLELVADAARDLLAQPVRAASAVPAAAASLFRLRKRRRRRDVVPTPRLFAAPRDCCNGRLNEKRYVGFTQLSLDDVKEVRRATGTTVNDVVLAVCAGAMRDHLRAHDMLPQGPLVAAIPVAVGDGRTADPNRLSAMLVELATGVEEPLTRLAAIAASSHAAKDHHHELGPHTLGRLADLTPPAVLAAVRAAQSHLAGRTPALCNLIVSNFPGPPFPLYMAGAQMLAAYPLGPLALGAGLNITVQSYLDTIWVGVIACPDTVPAPEQLPGRLTGALNDLTLSIRASGLQRAETGAYGTRLDENGAARAVAATRRSTVGDVELQE
jgi:diacylglycerol O-acyltransferase